MAGDNSLPLNRPTSGTRSRIRTAAGVHHTGSDSPETEPTAQQMVTGIKINTTPAVDAINQIAFSGVVIPHAWFKHIRTPAGAANPLAVMILADIVHFYKPSEKYDPETGRLTVHKKFRGQKLQRRNSEYAKMFGYSKSQVLRAIHQLVELGLVTQEIVEHMLVDEVAYNNVQYLEPVPARVAEITHYSPDLEAYLKQQRLLRASAQPIAQLHRDTTPAVDAIERINLTGNVLPPMWFRHIKTEAGGPYLLAVMILAELIYWYRPDTKRDPDTLAIVEINKRFDGHKYRMRNTSYGEYLGVSHDQVYRAIHRLAELGLITHELNRDEGNVQYVEPVPGRVESITFEAPGEDGPAIELADPDPEGLRASAPGLREDTPPLRADAPGLRTNAPPLREDASVLTRPRTTNTKTSSTRTSTKSSSTSSTTSHHAGDDVRALRADALRKMDEADRGVFEQLEALLGHYQVDGINRINLAHRLTLRASQVDGVGEWRPMVYRIANCWRKCSHLHKAGRVGDESGFTGFFVYKLRGMDSDYVAQAGEIDEGRARTSSADSVALAKQIEQTLMPATSRGKPAAPTAPKNSLTQQPPSQAERTAFAAVRQSLLNDEGLTHLASALAQIELLASDGVQVVIRAPDLRQVSLSSATLELILATRLEGALEIRADTLDVRVVE